MNQTTVDDLIEYLQWQSKSGHGGCTVAIDRRGIALYRQTGGPVGVGLPPAGERYDEKSNTVFVRAVP